MDKQKTMVKHHSLVIILLAILVTETSLASSTFNLLYSNDIRGRTTRLG